MFEILLTLQRKACRACELLIRRAQVAFHGRVADVEGIKLLLPANVLSTHMSSKLLHGGIDGEDRRLLRRYASPGDFVLNVGGGCGLSAMAAWRQVRPSGRVIAIEPDPLVHELARRNFQLNGMEAIESRAAAAVVDPRTTEITFYRKKNYYGSNLLQADNQSQAITVPTVYLPDLIDRAATGKKILLCDVEGYETELLADAAVVDCFDLIITELHFSAHPKDRVSPLIRMFDLLFARGFKIADIDDEGFVFERTNAARLEPQPVADAARR